MFTTEEKLHEIEREIAMRQRVYPRWIANGKLKPEQAAKQIAILQAIAHDLRAQIAAVPGPLFGDRR